MSRYQRKRSTKLFAAISGWSILLAIVGLFSANYAGASFFLGIAILSSYTGYRLDGAASNPTLYPGGKPPIPPISRTSDVIDWFLRYDDKIDDIRDTYLEKIVREEVLNDLSTCTSMTSLRDQVMNISNFYTFLLPQAAMRLEQPSEEDSPEDSAKIIAMEKVVAAKMRILGYFLFKRYGIDPSTLDGETELMREASDSGSV